MTPVNVQSLDWLFEVSPDPVAVVSDTFKVERGNAQLAKVLGADMMGESLLMQMKEPERGLVRRSLARSAEGAPQNGVLTNIRDAILEWSFIPVGGGRLLAMARDVTEEKLNAERLYRLAHFDPVTSLPNRLLFLDRVQQGLAQASREDRLAGIIYIDLDDFKPINDTYGHTVGDECLRFVATTLTKALRGTDTVTRLGGDEFAVFLPMLVDKERADIVAKRIVATFKREKAPTTRGGIKVAVSVGTALFPEDGSAFEEILNAADERMYQHKASKAFRRKRRA